MTERSDGNDTNVSSASTERAAGQPERYAHGSGIGEALVAWATQQKQEANTDFWDAYRSEDARERERAYGREMAFFDVLAWAKANKADAATSTQEEGIPTS